MRDFAGKVAFITGGGSGVGLGQAKVLARAGAKIVLADIRDDHLDAALRHFREIGARAHGILLDVTDRAAFERAAQETERLIGPVQLLFNTAGVSMFGPLEESTYDDYDWMMGVNFGGVVNGVRTFVPRIKAHGEGGHVVNTASMAAFIASGRAGIYCTAKFAVRGMSEALRASLLPHRIGVSVLCPGLVKSSIYESEQIRPAHLSAQATRTDPEFLARLAQVHEVGMDPQEVGQKVLRAIRRNDFYIFSHPEFKEELRGIFDEALQALPDEPAPAQRLAFEEGRRAAAAEARKAWPKL
jgi:NAD(P)-dependent dehydrogenase (short-subunit alcohol dehydrogenase family)